MIFLSVAHSDTAPGAVNGHVREYDISKRATEAAYKSLVAHGVETVLYDCGAMGQSAYAMSKARAANKAMPRLAIEIHCNSAASPTPCYSEVIHHPNSEPGQRAAKSIALTLKDALGKANHMWPAHGARANNLEQDGHHMFWLYTTMCPAVIVEGMFLSNPEQAAWLSSETGAETYGLLVAAGVLDWLKAEPK